ncbi:MAG: TonB-dependent receptor [Novosphingobium sp.]|nr:TonB-dependent receptor [Novosphingobium sp.]
MGTISVRSTLLLGAATAAFLATPALAQSGGLEEIIVTAQKREQSVQDVPIAVTAVTQETLQANRITTVNDLGSIAPGVTVRPSAGGVQVPSFTIRGQNSYGVVAGSDKQVSIYLDGVYISSPRGSIFDLPDVARLEVLRGPQGTLFGRNATAGAVSVTTRDPTGEPRVIAQGSYGNQNQYRVRMTADLPQMGPFSAYFSFQRNYRRGDVRNAAGGTVWDRTTSPDPKLAKVTRAANWLGTTDSNSYFGALKFEPSDSFKMVYKYDRNEDNGTPNANAIAFYNPAMPGFGPGAALIAPIFNALYASNDIYLSPGLQSPDVVSNSWSIPRRQRVYGHSLTATWQATDQITVKNIASYRQSEVFAPSAIDGTAGLTFTPQALVPYATFLGISSLAAQGVDVTNPANGLLVQQTIGGIAQGIAPLIGGRILGTASQASSIAKQWSNELQVNYTSEKLNLTAGALWFRSRDQAGGPVGQQNTFSFASGIIPASGLVPLGNEGRYFNKATSMAAYLQAEYKFTEQLELVLGGRITRDKKSSLFRWDILTGAGIVPQPTIIPPVYKKTKPNWLVGLNWKPNDDVLVYGKASTSFVSGGSVAGIEFVPETALSFELGLKADLLDRRLRANLAIFHVDYENFQQPSSTTSEEAVAFLTAVYGPIAQSLSRNLSTFVQQAHDVKAKGFELELTALPTDGLTLGGSVSYTDSKYYNIDPVFLAAQGGEYVEFARPKWTGSAFAQYVTPPLFGDTTASFRVDGQYRSYLNFTGTPTLRRNQGVPEQYFGSPGHWKINGRAAIRNIQLGGISAELAVWGRNITNKRYATSNIFLSQGIPLEFDQGKSYGIDFGIEF